MKKFVFSIIFLILTLSFTAFVRAEDLGVVKARMDQRLTVVDGLKAQGAVGENNRGFLEVRSNVGEASAVVSAENKDREVVYTALAEKTGTSADQVGKKRASKIAQNSRPGVWIQDQSGNWKQK
jgi:uncharacterized protein YdbL (DUF1318 family)